MHSRYHYAMLALVSALVGGFISFWLLPARLHAPTTPGAVNTEISTADWKTFTDPVLGFSVEYPPTFTVVDNKTSVFIQSDPDATKAEKMLKFEKITNTLPKEVSANFGVGVRMDWFTNERKFTALKLDIETDDAMSRERIYYFLKNFPQEPGDKGDRKLTMVRVGVSENVKDEIAVASAAGVMNMDEVKTISDAIVNTIRPIP